ncbi:cytochrome c biogenesis protein [Candidatus Poseidoniales archaeon]|nr:cytochrome c biogenesis protein [Candidatus Poseidoniales archaeon]RCH71636.1 MAG: hypothetical protein DBX06_03735 [Candidatus Poseidoniales archaeon]RCH72383.1 MAG: hypothetical protein DBX06_00455 [Candidatus Poseidoniales archaeon]
MNWRDSGYALTYVGLAGIVFATVIGLEYAPTIKACTGGGCFGAPEAYRILYLHVPFAWCSFLSFSVLFYGSIMWYLKRSEDAWVYFQSGSDLGLIFGLGVITSGPIWASAEWGTPWDWGDIRLNSFGLLSAIALFLVYSRRSQPDTPATRDTLSAIGLFGFALVPITAGATHWWNTTHPPLLVIESGEKVGMDSEIRTLLLLNFAIMCVLFVGFLLLSNKRYRLAAEVSSRKAELDEEAML